MRRYIYLVIFILCATLTLGKGIQLDDLLMGEYTEDTVISKEFKTVQAVKIATIDPIEVKDQYSTRAIKNLYDTLFIVGDSGEITPNLVKTWNWDDDRTLTLNLRDDVIFHNGDKLNSNSVKESLDRMRKKAVFKDFYNDIENIYIVDDDTLKIRLKGKNNMFLSMLTYEMSSIVKDNNGKLIGTGPYKLNSINNRELVMTKNNEYFKKKTSPEKIIITYEVSERGRIISFFNENVDAVSDLTKRSLLKSQEEGLISSDAIVRKRKEIDTVALMFGNEPLFKNREVRKTLESILDTEELGEKIFDTEGAKSFFPKELFKPKLSILKPSKVDKNVINKLKNQNIELVILNDNRSIALGEAIKKQLKKYGINIIVTPYQHEAYLMKIEKKNYQLALYDILFNEDYLIYNLGRVMIYDIGDLDMYNATKPFIDIMKNENKKENQDKIYDKIVSLMYKNIPFIPIVHSEGIVVGNEKLKEVDI